jgi:hypothetical protein
MGLAELEVSLAALRAAPTSSPRLPRLDVGAPRAAPGDVLPAGAATLVMGAWTPGDASPSPSLGAGAATLVMGAWTPPGDASPSSPSPSPSSSSSPDAHVGDAAWEDASGDALGDDVHPAGFGPTPVVVPPSSMAKPTARMPLSALPPAQPAPTLNIPIYVDDDEER